MANILMDETSRKENAKVSMEIFKRTVRREKIIVVAYVNVRDET